MGKLMDILREVKDPELGVSIVDMGLIYGAEEEGDVARVEMTLTTPTCPAAALLVGEVEGALREAGYEPEVELTFSPPWTPDKMSKELREKMGF